MRHKALKEWTEGAGLKEVNRKRRAPEKRGWQGGDCPPLLNEPQCGHNLLGQSCSLLSSQRVLSGPPDSPTGASQVWGPPSQSPPSPCAGCCSRSNQHTGQVYPTAAYESSIMALRDFEVIKCFS